MAFIGIDSDWKADLLWGAGFGLGLIVLNLLVPQFTIGFPSLPQATVTEKIFMILILAPIVEEFFFRGWLMGILDEVMPLFMAVILQAMAFAIFHLKVYAEAFSIQAITNTFGAFVIAGVFGVIFAGMAIYRQSQLPNIISHFSINGFLMAIFLVVVAF